MEECKEAKGQHDQVDKPWTRAVRDNDGEWRWERIDRREIHDRGLAARHTAQDGLARYGC